MRVVRLSQWRRVKQKDFEEIMKKNILSYSAPEVEIYEVAAERGYGDSVLLPGFGTEDDELVY